MAVAIGTDQAVAEFHGAELAAGVASEGFVGANSGGLFNGFFRHEIFSVILSRLQGGVARQHDAGGPRLTADARRWSWI